MQATESMAAWVALFVEESRTRLAEMSQELAAERVGPKCLSATERAVHQIAGGAAMVGCGGIAVFARMAECVVGRLRRGELPFGAAQRVLLQQAAAELAATLERAALGEVLIRPSPALKAVLEAWAHPGRPKE